MCELSFVELAAPYADLLLGLFFETEGGGNMFLQNIRLSMN
jgi:hypothetical protein